ncbi:MAG: hypothetical protein HY795_02205 [Desulfovibrio sp.]|nr:hypothetical protein [Desulfovibrio sp.]MBI4961148.1 hypothetical protein [Desulfovibrio sp.]
MNRTSSEKQFLRQFAEFVETDQVAPSNEVDEAVLRGVAKDLRPAPRWVYAKLTLTGAGAGFATLTLCPQFGLGFGLHNEFLHTLHAATSPLVFYLLCGALFMSLGALLGGLVLTRQDIRAISRTRHRYFAAYSVLAYATLALLGSEAFVAASLTWMVGAFFCNALCFRVMVRLRHA